MSSYSNNDETLLDLVVRGRWAALLSRAETHPDELASIGEDDGMTVFHWACVNDTPPKTLRALLRLDKIHALRGHKRAVLISDLNGITPLMSACSCRLSLEHVRDIIDSAPECIPMTDNDGWTALHFLCHNARNKHPFGVDALPLLLSRSRIENRKLAFLPARNNTPLSLACDSYGVTEGYTRDIYPTRMNTERDPVMCLQFVMCLIQPLLANDQKHWPFMSRLFSFTEIPEVVVKMALLLHSGDELLQVNTDGDIPLHVLVSKPWQAGIVKRVVEACPRAASLRNGRGLLPLQLALSTSNEHWNQDISSLVTAHPPSVEALELDDYIYSYLLRRLNNRLDTIFDIIRSKPALVR